MYLRFLKRGFCSVPGQWLWQILAIAGWASQGHAQELLGQPCPLTAWIDLRPAPPGAPAQTTPSWIEAFDFIPAQPGATTPNAETSALVVEHGAGRGVDKNRSIFRIRLQKPAAAVNDVQVRVFFEDKEADERPYVSVWNELGTEMMRSNPLGAGLGLPSSETLIVPMAGVDYVEISAPGDGSQVRSVFLSWLEKTHVLQPADFATHQRIREPFHVLSSTRHQQDDSFVYGVVTASLQGADPAVLKPGIAPTATFEFQLEHQPLLAIITYEVLGTTVGSPPVASVNGRGLGPTELYLPDLADPGYRGEQREAVSQMNFRYTGWVHAQKVIPGDMLNAGLNSLSLLLSEGSETVAVRSLEIQLKYNWEKLDYILAPAAKTYETH